MIVVDKYHVIRQATWAMERVRKNKQNNLSAKFRKYFKRSRYLLTRPLDARKPEEISALALMFEISPRLADAYRSKNEFLEITQAQPLDVPWTNGFIEDCNNKTKVLKRVCFGMRNFRNFRNRILYCQT